MPRRGSSQWEFGDLFASSPARRVLTVAELTGQVKRLVEQQVGSVWVTGEVSNLRLQGSGHLYFSLKDASSQLACVLFRGEPVAHRGQLQDGLKVILQGNLTVYEARGQYQMIVRGVELQGVGALQMAFERLKQKLAAEGLFAPERKRPIPAFPQAIGVVTSPTGAALKDVLHVVGRRDPGLQIVLAGCRVQGAGAAQEIADAIAKLNIWAAGGEGRLDAILVTRGGGSLEDLWAFNEEVVGRAIAASVLPVVSAVGHEIDFTISDFVADARAATPSAAAEMLTQGVFASRACVVEVRALMRGRVRRRWAQAVASHDKLGQRLGRVHPRRRLQEQMQRCDDADEALRRRVRQRWRELVGRTMEVMGRWGRLRLGEELKRRRERLLLGEGRLRQAMGRWVEGGRHRLGTLEARLRLLSPEQVLARGYSITIDAASGRVLRDAAAARPGMRLRTRLQRGEVWSAVEPEALVAGGEGAG